MWWNTYYDKVKAGFKGKSYTINDARTDINPSKNYDLIRIDSKDGDGLGENCLHYGSNSGYQAVNLAYILGAKTILLLGFDMFGSHYFGEHPDNLNKNSPYNMFIGAFNTINPEKYGIEIINCSRQSVLECFPRTTIDKILQP